MTYCLECSCCHNEGQHLPKWKVVNIDTEQMETIRAREARHAAERFAELVDASSDEHSVANGNDIIVDVTNGDNSTVRFRVEGECVPSYRARAVP